MEFQIPIIEHLKARKNFIELMNEHHILGLFHQYFNDSKLPLECNTQYKKQWIHNTIILEELELISLVAKRFDSEAIILKGAHLLFNLYTDLGPRFLSDIDLLVDSAQISVWEIILTECGFTARSERKFYGNRFKQDWFKFQGNIEINIELHTKLFFHLERESWSFTKTKFPSLNKLNNEDLLIHLCGHLAFQHSFLKLYWLFDIYFLIQNFENQINWKEVQLKTKDYNLYRSVQMCLWALTKYFGTKLDKKTLDLFGLTEIFWWQKYLTIDFLINPMENKSHYLIIKHATKDRLTTALYYNLTWFYHYKVQKLWSKEKA